MYMMFCINTNETHSFYDRSYYEMDSLEIDSRLFYMARNVYLKISDKKLIEHIVSAFKDNGTEITYNLFPIGRIDNKCRGCIQLSHRNLMDLHEIPEFIYFVIKNRDGESDIICGPDEPIQANSIICEANVTGYPVRRAL